MKKQFAAAVAAAAVGLAAPAAASAATLAVDPERPCYREQRTVFLPGTGFTPNALVDVSRDGRSLGQLPADASGAFVGRLDLPGLARGQERLTYVATDTTNQALTAQVSMLVTATDVGVRPMFGPSNRRLTITARGFFGGRTLWAHVVRARSGARASAVRNVRIGRVRGACKKVKAKRRLLQASAAPGRYRVQFDTFRRFKPNRQIEYDDLIVTVSGTQPAAAAFR